MRPSDRRPGRILCIQPQVPHYRVDFFLRLDQGLDGRLELIHGTRRPGDSLADALVPGMGQRQQAVPWSRICGQPSVRAVFAGLRRRPQAIIVAGMLQWPLVHLLVAWSWLTRTPIIAWCQLKRAGFRPVVVTAKAHWLRLFDGVLLYTDAERAELRARGFPGRRLSAMNNGLAWRMVGKPDLAAVIAQGYFIHCARLEPKNRCDLLIHALAAYRAAGGLRRLLVIGDGSERGNLEALASSLGIAQHVDFLGAIYDQQRVDDLVTSAYAMVHPFGVGLSMVSALVAGCPLIACSDRHLHMPEFWLWRHGLTGWGFPSGDSPAAKLAAAMTEADRTPAAVYQRMRRACYRATRLATTQGMATRVLRAVQRWAGPRVAA